MTSPAERRCDDATTAGVICRLEAESDRIDEADHDDPSAYLSMLAAYHRALAEPLREIVGRLPLASGGRAVDVACGDGAYAVWLAERVGDAGQVIAADINPACLELAAEAAARAGCADSIRTCRTGAESLPFPDGQFDLAWCAQSLYSLPKTLDSLREIFRVVRPGGVVAVLENDSLHDLLLPWPVELELEIHAAEWKAYEAQTQAPSRYYIGRWLSTLFQQLGLARPTVRVWATTRQPPLTADERAYLSALLHGLRRRVAPHLASRWLAELDRLLDPAGSDYLLDRDDLVVTFLNRLAWAVKP
jgi:ubiquinone/menaquinone biosynthesis C-methylase UbiE